MKPLSLTVNGKTVTASVEPRLNLADFLRDHQLLTGTHIGCEHGVCGACTLIVNGEPARSCIALAVACDGAEVRTIEDLDEDPVAIRLRAAFTAEHGLQCGYCTPGILVTARDIVLRLPDADADRIRLELSGNLCRCTGYAGIVRAIERVLRERPVVDAPKKVPIAERKIAAPAPPATAAAPVRAAAPVSASPDSTLRQTITIALPPDRIWAAVKDPTLVASCVPGVTLAPSSSAENLAGEMAVAFGPLRARFAGTATVRYDDAAQSGTIRGEGRDSATGTRLRTDAEFRVSEHARGSKIDLTAAYALQGPLAQFSRGALVQALAGELCREVARNLEARLTGGAAAPPQPAKFSAGAFLLGVIWRRLKALFGAG
ncbi:MAG TPA: 2Fe-2S iron-sulfur cluster-binding protein [Stellaceae bacterium]|nr:2Fe-2S iron-sulfur cluster-binding protein [Stellaceae bacterium]